ncbi:single-stranded DNA-binding protein [Helcobacillus massiliensis]|uniref:single-stranded DNA-binding protein n=1 Tax=Helcobacillus TaxID=1161125 RepID=UPI001EF5D9F6|nr:MULTISPECIES: single-stranded DNA-binding protein [Helcobacillus]MCG7428018.1 single-stranded DNA-binding protein [Helcobacillus sp. ACRRO]MCT1557398.1 single-stranded DNA-binding protein [Helcobacillus massiliensis]MCT2036879.1 single-stranded DNA-binding protein [Helcobacillus massiliensis]MCT2331683.1 single-stranded DNA-binding protein [Helcobacillus massiliensis]MDK7742876.1 single-stranded DNA-binding protein [Helcobacillus massiliensis]
MSAIRTTIVGNIAQPIRLQKFPDGNLVVTFTVAVNDQYLDKKTGEFADRGTEFVRVQTRRRDLCLNADASLSVGDPVIVTGRLTTHSWKGPDNRDFFALLLHAEALGPSLQFGTTRYFKNNNQKPVGDDGEQLTGGEDTSAELEGRTVPDDTAEDREAPVRRDPSELVAVGVGGGEEADGAEGDKEPPF